MGCAVHLSIYHLVSSHSNARCLHGHVRQQPLGIQQELYLGRLERWPRVQYTHFWLFILNLVFRKGNPTLQTETRLYPCTRLHGTGGFHLETNVFFGLWLASETGHALCSPGWPQLTNPLLHHLEWQNHMCVHQTQAHFNFIWRFQNKEQSRYLRYFCCCCCCNSVVVVWLRAENETVCVFKQFPESTEQPWLRTLRQQSFNISWWVRETWPAFSYGEGHVLET